MNRHLRFPPPRPGFTIIELMVTVAIVAIMFALAAPALNNVLAGRVVAAQADDLSAALRYARSEAMKRGTPVTVCKVTVAAPTTCSTAGGTWQNWMVFADATGSGTIGTYDGPSSADVVLKQQYQASSYVAWQAASPAALNYVTFQATGIAVANASNTGVSSGASTVTFTINPKMSGAGTAPFNRNVRQICLNAQGRVRLIDGLSTCP